VTVDVPVVLVGEAAVGTLVVTELNTLSVEAEATHLPESIEVDIEGLAVGDQILAGDVRLVEGVTLVVDPDHLVVLGSAAPTAEELDAEMAEAEAEAGIERDEPEAELDPAAEAAESDDAGAAARRGVTSGQVERSREPRWATCGWSSASAIPVPPTPGPCTTSATWSATSLLTA
jgi:large subunit ribosomal protein L25